MIGFSTFSILSEATLLSVLILIVSLIILWIIVSIPAYVAGKVVTKGKSTFGEAMIATVLGPIVYVIVTVAVDFFLEGLIGSGAYIWGLILAFVAWVWVYKSTFKTGWLGGLAIAILAIIVFIILAIVLGILFSFTLPAPTFPKF
jgi:hypothetical protein